MGSTRGVLSSPLFWYWLVAGSTWLVVYWVCTWPWDGVRFDSDYWEHSAAIAEWTRHLWAPQNPHLAIETGSPRYMPYFFVLAATARLFDLDPFQALALGAGLNMGLLAVGVLLFFRRQHVMKRAQRGRKPACQDMLGGGGDVIEQADGG